VYKILYRSLTIFPVLAALAGRLEKVNFRKGSFGNWQKCISTTRKNNFWMCPGGPKDHKQH